MGLQQKRKGILKKPFQTPWSWEARWSKSVGTKKMREDLLRVVTVLDFFLSGNILR
jgi:hypothetical protein